ncbi:MAG: hypothetical protein ABEJ65_12035 [bacterium]
MDSEQINQLSNQLGVSETRAREALARNNENFDEAASMLREAPVAIKGRFASQVDNIYGLFYLELEVSPPSLQECKVTVGNDRGISNVRLKLDHTEFSRAIDRVSNEKSTMSALTRQLKEGLLEHFSPPESRWIDWISEGEDVTIEKELSEEVATYIEEEDIILTVELEPGLIDTSETEAQSTESEESRTESEDERVELLCDVRVSPVRGQEANTIREGEALYVDIKDGQNEHSHLIDVINDQLRDEDVRMIPARVQSIEPTKTGKLEFLVQFGENVFGRVKAGEDMNLMTVNSVQSSRSTDDEMLPAWLWGLFFMTLTGLAIIVWYLWVMSEPVP